MGDQRKSDEAGDDAARLYASQLDEQIADSHEWAADAEGSKGELHRRSAAEYRVAAQRDRHEAEVAEEEARRDQASHKKKASGADI